MLNEAHLRSFHWARVLICSNPADRQLLTTFEARTMSTAPCPTRPVLEDLLAGRLCFERHVAIEGHVRACADCQAVVDGLAEPQDAFLSSLRDALDPSPIRARRPLRKAVECLKSSRNEESPPHALVEVVGPRTMLPGAAAGAGLLGDYRILRELGRGGMGIVYEAEQISLGRRVALKILPFAPLMDPRQLQRFQNEARAVATLEHPNIVTVYGVGTERGVHYYAMRYIDGHNLAQIIDRLRQHERTPVSGSSTSKIHSDATPNAQSALADLLNTHAPADPAYLAAVVRIGIETAEALDYAHERGIVHRDVKPSNLMLDQTGRLWVTDFGLARIEADPTLSMSGGVLGTLRYMSPEQALGKRGLVDHRSDIYSLGTTLYELLTLTPIFPEATRETLPSRIATDEPRPPRHLNPQIPSDLETILLKAMAKNAADRYATAGEFAEDLKRFVEARPILARPVGRATRFLKWTRRRPAVAGLLAVCLVATVSLLVGSWWHTFTLQGALDVAEKSRAEAERQRRATLDQEAVASEREERVRCYLYASDMKQAFAAWNSFHLGESLELLSRHRPKPQEKDLRGFAWYYLWRLCHSERLTLRGHSGDVSAVAFSPDGRRLATVSFDGTAKLWDAVTGKELATFLNGHKKELNAVAFSPDGKTLATGGDDGEVRLWDVESRQQRALLLGHKDDVHAVAFSPDGKTLASGGEDQVVRMWDVATGKERTTLRGHHGRIRALAYSPDGTKLATAGGDADAKIWNLATGRVETTFTRHRWSDGLHDQLIVVSIAFSHDGKLVASGGEDHAVRIWDPITGREQSVLRANAEVAQTVEFTPDDRTLAAAAKDGNVWLWDVASGTCRNTIRAHGARLRSATLSPDGRTLATASADRTARLWALGRDPARQTILGIPRPVKALGFLPGGKELAAAAWHIDRHSNPGLFRVWDLSADREALPRKIDPEIGDYPILSPDGTNILFHVGRFGMPRDDDPRYLNNMLSRASIGTNWKFVTFALAFEPNKLPFHESCRALSVSGEWLAVGEDTGTVEVWGLRSRVSHSIMATRVGADVEALAFSPDSKLLAAGGQNGEIKLWDRATGAEQAALRGHQARIYCLYFSGDGSILASASADNTAKLWDVATARERTTLRGHNGDVRAIALSPDRRTVATGVGDGTVKLWDIATAQEIASLDAQHGGIQVVTFSSDGKILASGGAAQDGEGQIFLWRAAGEDR